MISAEQQRDWLQNLVTQEGSAKTVNDDWFQQARSDARHAITTLPPLTNKLEAWRYSRIDKLFEMDLCVAAQDDAVVREIDINKILISEFDSYRLVIVNGRYQERLSSAKNLPVGVRLSGFRQALGSDDKFLTNKFGQY